MENTLLPQAILACWCNQRGRGRLPWPESAATRDKHHDPAGASNRATVPVAVHMLDGESRGGQRISQLCQAAKAQLAARDHDLAGGDKNVVALEANPALAHADQLQPTFHRPVGRIDLLKGRLAVP